ncbi:extracellular solute-binding protein, partial [Caldicellulosiruptor sp. DIB 104C]
MKKWLKVVALAILVVFSFSVVLVGQMGEKKVQGATNELTFWSWVSDSDTIKQVYEQAIKEFNSTNKYGVKIKAVYTPGEQYKTKLQTAMAANNPPDILNMWAAGKMKPYVDA